MTTAARDRLSIIWVKDELKKRIKLRNLGPTLYLLAISIIRDRSQRSISLSQRHHTVTQKSINIICDLVKNDLYLIEYFT